MPNKLPQGWVVCQLKDIGDIVAGGTPSTKDAENFGGNIAWITPADLSDYKEKFISHGKRNITEIGLKNSSAKLMPKGAILFSSRAPIGYTVIASNPICTNQGFKNIVPSKYVFNEYIYYYLKNSKALVEKYSSGTTFKEISGTKFGLIPFPLPPHNEQRRIVEKIESEFAKIDEGLEHLEKAKEQIKQYRQSVLKSAFSNCSSYIKVGELCEVVRGGSPRPAGDEKYYNGHIPFLKVADITKDNNKYLNEYTYTIKEAGLKKTRLVNANTLLLSNSGATLGVPKICTFATTFNDGIAAFLGLSNETLDFHYYYWLSKTKELRCINQGAAQPNLNTDIIKEQLIPNLNKFEQKKIVKEIEKRFAVADEVEKVVEDNIEKAKQLKQSILKKAFEGRLVPQDPTDEPASTLLEKIKQERCKK